MITGVPREAGTTVVTLRANSNPDDGAQAATKSCSITVNPTVMQLTSGCALPPATAGVPYSQTLAVDGGFAPYTWTATSPLPAGLVLSRDGVLSGSPGSNNETFTLRVQDSRGTVSDQTCTLPVHAPVISVTTACPLPAGTTGQPYSFRMSASGGTGPYSWSVLGGMPAGMSVSGDGVLSGNPGSAGPITFRFLVTDSDGNSAAAACNLVVLRSNFSLTSCPLPNGAVGADYQQLLNVDGGTPPYIYTVVNGLPTGLSLNSTGLMAGRPREAGKSTVTLRVMDSTGRTATQACGLLVSPSPLTITGSCPLPEARVGTPYVQRFSATGGNAPYRFRLDGTLPSGLELASDGTMRGMPVAASDSEFEIEAVDASGRSVPKRCSLRASLPEFPTFRIDAIPATIAAAANGPMVRLELSHAYSLPMQGEFVLSAEADTGSFEPVINQPDPRVRFANGERRLRFTIPAGTTQATAPIVSTGTVASLVTVRAINFSACGVPIPTAPAPRQFRVNRGIPVITDACLSAQTSNPELRITGYTTTRQLDSAEFSYTAAGQQHSTSINVSASAGEYFASDESVRNGGAFTVTVPLTLQGEGTLQPNNITLSNSVGATAGKTVAACR